METLGWNEVETKKAVVSNCSGYASQNQNFVGSDFSALACEETRHHISIELRSITCTIARTNIALELKSRSGLGVYGLQVRIRNENA